MGAGRGPFFSAENWKNSGALSGRLRCCTALPAPEPPGMVSSYEPQYGVWAVQRAASGRRRAGVRMLVATEQL